MNLFDSASLVVTPNAYKTSKLYSIVPSDGTGDMTFSRTGDTATRVNSSGLIESVLANKPRLDYLGSTCPRLLIEPQRTNLVLQSEALDNSTWSTYIGNASISANAINSPSGVQNADKVIGLNATSSNQYIQQRAINVTAQIYTASIFVKKGEWNTIKMFMLTQWASAPTATFNIDTLAITTLANATAKIEDYGNGWFRCSLTATTNATAGSNAYIQVNIGNNGSVNQTGNGTLGLYLWGAQLEAGSTATSYIPTTTASVTRNQDVCEKTSISSLIGQTEGTMFADFVLSSLDESRILIGDGTASNRIYMRVAPNGSILFEVIIGTVAIATISTNVSFASIGTRYKLAAVYKTNDFTFYINGVQIGVDTSGTIANTLNRFALDGYITTYANFNHKINSLALWKTRLTNSELATLTTI